MNFCIILGGFWHHFGSPNAFKNRVKFWMRFWRPNEANKHLIWGRLGGMRGGPGEDNGGVQRIEAETRGQGPGVPALRLARRPQYGGGSLRAFRPAALLGC